MATHSWSRSDYSPPQTRVLTDREILARKYSSAIPHSQEVFIGHLEILIARKYSSVI